MKNLLKNGYRAKLRPSGHDISTKFQNDRGGAIPPNIIADIAWGEGGLIGKPVLGEFNCILENDLAQPVNVISASNTASNDYYQRRCKEDNSNKYIKGKALELLAIWMIRLTSLRFTKWRKRDYETGQGEVDVLAASDRFVYHRWQIQCKNTKRVDVRVNSGKRVKIEKKLKKS